MAGNSTNLIHGADHIVRVKDVVPPINISTTYRYDSDPSKLIKVADKGGYEILNNYWYSRLSHPNSEQIEQAVSKVTGGYVVAYSSGLSAFYALMTHYNPKVLAIGEGYHGIHGIADIFTRNQGLKQIKLDEDFSQLNKGDIVHLETPVNPEGITFDIKYYADKAHERGAYLSVDATFAPPPLSDPFKFGADIILHSATKFFGGHSDLLAGFLITKSQEIRDALLYDRLLLGTNIANLESSLLIRGIRTLDLRVRKQSDSATKIVDYLSKNKSKIPGLVEIYHGSLQTDAYIKDQMPNGHSPVFSIKVESENFAKYLPSKLQYFYHATSLGGVESLIEWRALSDPKAHPGLLRVSIGVEDYEDLLEDLLQAFSATQLEVASLN
ncbi:Cys/Met metabolism PLP-dependent enzyme-domain-containing protein [Scheffersomyces amazonensis]|uniref:Cys/Met metabolism PLP-dependent enzyme-domain-containing protein n=1 Tax=Scheffersomyces amazonensis TaxID=1078765 RepID=UPI00315D221D